MKKKKLKNRIVEIYQIVSELCGAGLAGLNGTKPVEEINDLMKPMEKYGLAPYTNNPVNMTNWKSYSPKLKKLIKELRRRGLIK